VQFLKMLQNLVHLYTEVFLLQKTINNVVVVMVVAVVVLIY
jgi:hypothetical protein